MSIVTDNRVNHFNLIVQGRLLDAADLREAEKDSDCKLSRSEIRQALSERISQQAGRDDSAVEFAKEWRKKTFTQDGIVSGRYRGPEDISADRALDPRQVLEALSERIDTVRGKSVKDTVQAYRWQRQAENEARTNSSEATVQLAASKSLSSALICDVDFSLDPIRPIVDAIRDDKKLDHIESHFYRLKESLVMMGRPIRDFIEDGTVAANIAQYDVGYANHLERSIAGFMALKFTQVFDSAIVTRPDANLVMLFEEFLKALDAAIEFKTLDLTGSRLQTLKPKLEAAFNGYLKLAKLILEDGPRLDPIMKRILADSPSVAANQDEPKVSTHKLYNIYQQVQFKPEKYPNLIGSITSSDHEQSFVEFAQKLVDLLGIKLDQDSGEFARQQNTWGSLNAESLETALL